MSVNTPAPVTIEEYRGITDLVAAEVTKDDSTGYTTGDVFEIAGVSQLVRSTTTSSDTHYYNNKPAVVVSGAGGDTVTIDTSAIPMDVFAKITGQIYDETLGVMYEGQPKTKYFAIGYKTKTTSGTEVYVWRLKGSFTIPDETHATENGDTGANGQSLVYNGVETTYKFRKNNRSEKAVSVNATLDKVDVATFFDTVVTPDTITAKAAG